MENKILSREQSIEKVQHALRNINNTLSDKPFSLNVKKRVQKCHIETSVV